MSFHGKVIQGKKENRKEIANIALMQQDVLCRADYVRAHEPLLQSHHGSQRISWAGHRQCLTRPASGTRSRRITWPNIRPKLAADSRSFPVFIYDPRKGARIKERLSLAGNPGMKEDWYVNPKTGEAVDFVTFARSEGRFAKHFDKDGNPSATILSAQQDRLENWRMLQELAGIKVVATSIWNEKRRAGSPPFLRTLDQCSQEGTAGFPTKSRRLVQAQAAVL